MIKSSYPGKFEISYATLVTNSGYVADITKLIVNLKIQESIFSDELVGNLVLVETTDLMTHGPIIGQEILRLKLKTSISKTTKDAEIIFDEVPLLVYDVVYTPGNSPNESENIMTLSFVSYNSFKNTRTRLSKSYTANCSDIIESVLTKELKTKSDFFIEKTINNVHMISPNVRPYKFIDMISKRALNINDFNSFLFYETVRGFKFKSIDTMLRTEPVFTYKEDVDIDVDDVTDVFKSFETINAKNISDVRNVIAASKTGYFASKLLLHDIYNKRVIEKNTNFTDENKGNIPFSLSTYEDGESLIQKNDMMIYSQVYNSGKTVSSKFQGDKYLDSLLKRKSKMLHFQRSINIGISVYGYTKMNCGDKVSISLRKKSDSFSDRDFPMYDGDYIIVSIQHDFDFNAMIHNMDLSCSKITLTEGIPKSKYIEKP